MESDWKILIVEDEDEASLPLSALLEAHGYRCSVAENGQAAIAAAERLHPDVLLLDIGLPDISGVEVVTELRKRGLLGRCRVLAVTGSIDERTRQRCREAGFNDFFAKPIDIDEMLRVLGALDPV